MKTLKQEIKDILSTFSEKTIETFFLHQEIGNKVELFKNISITLEEEEGGAEQGSDFYTIYKFEKDLEIEYVKFQGWYQSYVGSEYEEYYFVIPEKIQVTRFIMQE